MGVSFDDLITPLDPADVRADLRALGSRVGLTIPESPGNMGYQLVDTIGRWGTRLWNKYAIPALKAQFGELATGDWAMLKWASVGVDKGLATFATGPVPIENRSSNFYDLSTPGSMTIANPAGKTFVSVSPPPGFDGTLAPWTGSGPYPSTTLTFEASEVGTASNTQAATILGFPTPPASAPPGVYVLRADQPALLGSNGETDPALLTRGRATVAQAAPFAPLARYTAVALSTLMPGGIPVSTSRVRVHSGAALVFVFLATLSGPTPGDDSTAGTEVYEINARIQALCGAPGLRIFVEAATLVTVAVGVITIYVRTGANVTQASAEATARAAIDDWQSKLPIGGMRKQAGGVGFVLADELRAIAMSEVAINTNWARATIYLPGDSMISNGGTYYTVDGGLSATTGSGPSGQAPSLDGAVTWIYVGPARAGYVGAPGVFDCDLTLTDTALSIGDVAVITYSINVVIVEQES